MRSDLSRPGFSENREPPSAAASPSRRGFVLVEKIILCICLVVNGLVILASSRNGSESARAEKLKQVLDRVRPRIEAYFKDHHRYPNREYFALQMTCKTDQEGRVVAGGRLGPYLRAIPANPMDGQRRVGASQTGSGGWFYDPQKGRFASNDPTVRWKDYPTRGL